MTTRSSARTQSLISIHASFPHACTPQYGLESLRQQGLPVDGLSFDSQLVIRGLIMVSVRRVATWSV